MNIMLNKHRRSNKFNRRGTTAIEFALVAPVFFLFVIAAVDFGRMNILRHTADNAAYEAARHAMVPGATAAEAITKANTILSSVGTIGSTVTVDPAVLGLSVEEITVTVNIPMNQNGWIAPHFTDGKTIVGRSRLRTERIKQ
jgi:Flp pilus assembly protein TadG